MRAVDVIMKKRDGAELLPRRDRLPHRRLCRRLRAGLPGFGLGHGRLFQGHERRETADLTDVMLRSGKVMDLSGIAGPFVDKHSTGGVGDKVSLVLAPMVAACGVKVPMMSGRALGHTGGTLDKLESIPGYRTALSEAEFREFIGRDGYAMTGQTSEVVPADRKLYALRDVTATVESIPLITASILSKKVAEGAEALVFDVKAGPGAFMKTAERAEELARSLVSTGTAMGKRVVGVITDMTEPLGNKVGNFLEVEESLECLEGVGPADLMEVVYRLGAWMLVAGGAAKEVAEGERLCRNAIRLGIPRELFFANVRSQGGQIDRLLELRDRWRAKDRYEVLAPASGFIAGIDAYRIGLAGVYLGVGRDKTTDPVFPDVGFVFKKKAGHAVVAGEHICTAYGKDAAALEAALPLIVSAFSIADSPPPPRSLVIKEISAL